MGTRIHYALHKCHWIIYVVTVSRLTSAHFGSAQCCSPLSESCENARISLFIHLIHGKLGWLRLYDMESSDWERESCHWIYFQTSHSSYNWGRCVGEVSKGDVVCGAAVIHSVVQLTALACSCNDLLKKKKYSSFLQFLSVFLMLSRIFLTHSNTK